MISDENILRFLYFLFFIFFLFPQTVKLGLWRHPCLVHSQSTLAYTTIVCLLPQHCIDIYTEISVLDYQFGNRGCPSWNGRSLEIMFSVPLKRTVVNRTCLELRVLWNHVDIVCKWLSIVLLQFADRKF